MADLYRERPSRIEGAFAWEKASSNTGRVLPDGCMDILWAGGVLTVAGPDTAAYVTGEPGHYTGLRFAPGTGPAVIGVPAHELRDQRVPLADLWPCALVRRLTDRVMAAADKHIALEDLALERMRETDRSITQIVACLNEGATVAAAAAHAEMGQRRLHRRCLEAFGYGPKTLARILRMNRALGLARSGAPFATVAAEAGYADQAHLSRDIKDLAGVTLSELI